jgi:hypothetical protein
MVQGAKEDLGSFILQPYRQEVLLHSHFARSELFAQNTIPIRLNT